MAVATLAQIREGLAANLAARIPGVQVSAYLLSAPVPPCIYLVPQRITYHEAMGAVEESAQSITFAVRCIVSLGLTDAAQMRLDELVSSGAVPAALESDPTLAGKAHTLVVTGLTRYEPVVLGEGQECFLAEFEVVVTL